MTFLFCIGKDETLDSTHHTVTHSVVMRFMEGIEGKGHHLYMDNYYSGPILYKDLQRKGIGACRTVRVNRKGIPVEWSKKKRKQRKRDEIGKGEVRTRDLGDELTALQWKDKRLITMISSIHDDEMTSKRRRTRLVTAGCEEIRKPVMIDEYNSYMGGVDKSDQLLSYYGFKHRTIKWWKRAAFHLIDLSVVNAYILYKMSVQSKHLSHKDFRVTLAKELLLKYSDVTTGSNPSRNRSSLPPPARLCERHFPDRNPVSSGGSPTQLECVVCSYKKGNGRKRTIYSCNECKVPLCIVPCFRLYHTYVDPARYL